MTTSDNQPAASADNAATGNCEHEWVHHGTHYAVTPEPNWSLTPTHEGYKCVHCDAIHKVKVVNPLTITEDMAAFHQSLTAPRR